MSTTPDQADSSPARSRNIILIGYRGCGKTSVAATLAARLGYEHVDTDEWIEAVAGCSIRDIFSTAGEDEFRRLEAAALGDALGDGPRVVSVGGGAVLSADNRVALRSAGSCIWLKAPAGELYQRLQADPRSTETRPPLTEAGGLAEVRNLLARREPLYAELADHVVETAGQTVEQVACAVHSIVTGGPNQSEET